MSGDEQDQLAGWGPDAGRGQVVLNVNGNEASRYLVSRILRGAGFEVVEAATASEALARVRERPDLVVLDIRLPDGNGIDVCRRIKADPVTREVAVLHLSGSVVSPDGRAEGLESGADGYLTHPVEPRELLATVRALLRTRAAEESSRREARAWQTSFGALRDGVALLDAGARIVRANRALAELLEQPPSELPGRDADALFRARFGVPLPREAAELRAGERWFGVRLDPVLSPGGAAEGAVLVLAEVSARKALEEELRRRADEAAEQSRRKDEFLAMLAHELRNPLAAATASMHLLERTGSTEAQAVRLREVVNRQLKLLGRLVDDLLDVSRITRGKVELQREPVELAGLVSSVVAGARGLLEARRHTLRVSLPGRSVPLLADPVRLDQVVNNLLSNAAKYTPEGGKVTVRLEVEDAGATRWARLVVEDSGVGLEPSMLGRVFDVFFQAEATLDRQTGGLGVGLTLVKQLVELHGGRVEAQSAGKGQGSRFIVRLPLATAEAPVLRQERLTPAPVARLRLLVVEDHDDVRDMLVALLERWGHSVDVASDGHAGLARAVERPYDAALVDIGLPGLDGYALARAVRAHPVSASLPLVALTGYGRGEDRQRALEAGFDVHLVKPVAPEELHLALLGAALRRRTA